MIDEADRDGDGEVNEVPQTLIRRRRAEIGVKVGIYIFTNKG